jgi:Uma2 family endonuclease
MMTAVPSPRKLTEAEYLALERAAETKSEFFDGEMFGMAGGSRRHSLIGTNLAAEFRNRLGHGPCVPYNADLRIKIEATGLFTYPDLSVVCGPAQTLDDGNDTLRNPTLIVEVLSDSTEAYDRGQKFVHYQQIPSLKEYLLVSQHQPRIEQFVRTDARQWLFRFAEGMDATLQLPSLGVTISLAEVFARVEFVPTPIRAPAPPRR